MGARRGIVLALGAMMFVGAARAGELAVGESARDAFGIEGLELRRVEVPEYGWWPRWVKYYEFAYEGGGTRIDGVIVEPAEGANARAIAAPYPGVVINHGHSGYAKEWGMEYGWRFAVNGYAAIACNYTHSLNETVETEKTTEYPWKTEENVKRASAALRVLGRLPFVDESRLYMYGHSQGGAFTTYFAGKTEALKAAATTAGGLRGTEEDAAIAAAVSCPMLIMHGTADYLDFHVSLNLYDALKSRNHPCKIVIFEDEPHQVIHYRTRDVFDEMLTYFDANK